MRLLERKEDFIKSKAEEAGMERQLALHAFAYQILDLNPPLGLKYILAGRIPQVYTPAVASGVKDHHQLKKIEPKELDPFLFHYDEKILTDIDSGKQKKKKVVKKMVRELGDYLDKLYHYHTKGNLRDLSRSKRKEFLAGMVVVGTDGGRILGIGDWGANGRRICKGKAACYFLGANGGFLPEQLAFLGVDVGTDRKELCSMKDYDGLTQPRKRGKNYYRFLQLILKAIDQLGIGLFQFEDFQGEQAWELLSWARENLENTWVFNDDLEGTGAMIASGLLTAEKQGIALTDSLFVFNGAGGAASGIASQLLYLLGRRLAKKDRGLLRERLVFADSADVLYEERKVKSKRGKKEEFKSYQLKKGLLVKGERLKALKKFMQKKGISVGGRLALGKYLEFVGQEIKEKRLSLGKRGTIFLIGTTTKAGTITEEIIKRAYQIVRENRPVAKLVLLGISNPTPMTDFLTQQESSSLKKAGSEKKKTKLLQKALKRVLKLCQGRVVMAAGSPFPAVSYKGKKYEVAQGNNFLIFPGVGLGFSLVNSRIVLSIPIPERVWPEIWSTASQALVDWYEKNQPARFKKSVLLPEASNVPAITEAVGLAVGLKLAELTGKKLTEKELKEKIRARRSELQARVYPSEKETAKKAAEKTLEFIGRYRMTEEGFYHLTEKRGTKLK